MAVPQYTDNWQSRLEGNILEYENTDGFPMYSLDSIVGYFNAADNNPRIYNYFIDVVSTRGILIRSLRHILSNEETRERMTNKTILTLTTGLSTLVEKLKTRSYAERRNMDVEALNGLLKKIRSVISSPRAGGRRKRTYKRVQKRKHTRRRRRHA